MKFIKSLIFSLFTLLLLFTFVSSLKADYTKTCEDYGWDPFYNFEIRWEKGKGYTAYDDWNKKIYGPKYEMKRWGENRIEYKHWKFHRNGRKSYTTTYWGDIAVCQNQWGQIKYFSLGSRSETEMTGYDEPDRDGGGRF